MSKPGRRRNRQNKALGPQQGEIAHYTRRQPARALGLILGIPMLVALLAALGRSEDAASLWLVSALFLLTFALFSSLRIELDETHLAWRFGPGLIRKRVALSDVVGATIVRTSLFDGVGIHYTKYGWYYAVSGRDAVAVRLSNGSGFALGTDDPVGLWEAIERRLGSAPE